MVWFLVFYFSLNIHHFLFIHLFSTKQTVRVRFILPDFSVTNTNKTHHVCIIMCLFLSNSLFLFLFLNFICVLILKIFYSFFLVYEFLDFKLYWPTRNKNFPTSQTHIENTNWDLLNDSLVWFSVCIYCFYKKQTFLHIQEYIIYVWSSSSCFLLLLWEFLQNRASIWLDKYETKKKLYD